MEGELGVTLPLDSVATTADLDIAHFQRLSVVLEDTVQPSLAETFSALRFDPVQGLDSDSVWRWRQGGDTGMMVEFLTPSFEAEEGIRNLPALGVKARALPHLNYLISDPIHAVALYRDGILGQIPRPEKFAIHKPIVANRRRDGPGSFKAEKDRQQAALIIATMAEDRPSDIRDAYADAMARGPWWRERIERSLERMPDTRAILSVCQDGWKATAAKVRHVRPARQEGHQGFCHLIAPGITGSMVPLSFSGSANFKFLSIFLISFDYAILTEVRKPSDR